MLADAYKIASDIKNAMPALKSDSMVASTSAVLASFKSKIIALLPPLKYQLSSITQRLDKYMTNDLVKHQISGASLLFNDVTSVNDCMIEMAKYVYFVIDNADVYEGNSVGLIWRWTPASQTRNYVFAHEDIDDIVKAAGKCIDVIYKRVIPK